MRADDEHDLSDVRRELGEILDRLAELRGVDIGERGRLRIRREELAAHLRAAAEGTPPKERWEVRPRQPEDRGRPYIESGGEGGAVDV